MHFLHLVQLYQPAPSGAARYFIEIGERLVREGHRVTVLATDAFDLEHFWRRGRRSIPEPVGEHNGVQIRRFPARRLPGPWLLYPIIRRLMVEASRAGRLSLPLLYRMAALTPRLPALERYLRESPELADVALVHSTNITLDFALVPVLRWAERRRVPHICTPFVHLGEPGNPQILRYYSMPHQIDMLRRSAAVITQTGLERRFLAQAGVPDQIMHTIGVGVNPEEVLGGDGERFRREHNISGPVVLTIGTAAFDKGTPHVVQAMQRLWAQGVGATWVQIGPLMEHFQQFYAGLPEADKNRTRLLGFVPDGTRRDALAAANVFVLPSRTDSFGIVFLEAWCYGVPVVGAAAGGVPEVITDGTNGLLVPFGDVAALAGAFGCLLHDGELARALGAAGRARVLRELTWEQKYAQVRAVYQAMVR
ncbi:MAG: glycosyltransferase family 4 protein [Chloroflexaceae bacterium]|jgi:glycosyltransferase involved in cell wall biosynthesis|nr:glycosyltransferase family 4 protein [Chloroflexaceae bacterium]